MIDWLMAEFFLELYITKLLVQSEFILFHYLTNMLYGSFSTIIYSLFPLYTRIEKSNTPFVLVQYLHLHVIILAMLNISNNDQGAFGRRVLASA